MSQIIDITKFFIISQNQFETIITQLNVNLTVQSDEYMMTYLFTNFFAYFLIGFTLYISMRIHKKLHARVFNAKLI